MPPKLSSGITQAVCVAPPNQQMRHIPSQALLRLALLSEQFVNLIDRVLKHRED